MGKLTFNLGNPNENKIQVFTHQIAERLKNLIVSSVEQGVV